MKNFFTLTVVLWAAGMGGFCQGTVLLTVAQAAPLQAFAGADLTIPRGESATIGGNPSALEGYGSYIYLWSPADGLNDPTLPNPVASPATTTTYLLTVTDSNHCSSMDEVTVSVDASSVENLPARPCIRCYPNPVADLLLVEMTGMPASVTLRIISPIGTEIQNRRLNPVGSFSMEKISLRDLPAGVYFLQVISAETTLYQSILKTRQP